MENKIQTQIQNLKQFKKERKLWMALSAIVLITMTGIVLDWPSIFHYKLEWVVGGFGILISMAWWFWTMRIVKELITIKIQDREILQEIIEDIKHIRKKILKTLPNRD